MPEGLSRGILSWIFWRAPFCPAYRWPLYHLYCPCGCGLSKREAKRLRD